MLYSTPDGRKQLYHGIYKRLPIAIKTIHDHRFLIRDEFELELVALFSMRHRNIIPLVAMSLEQNQPLCLLSPLLPNGSLASMLEKKKQRKKLSSSQRLQIAIDIFRGLNFLHAPFESKPEILHRNIKASNILIDANFNSRLSDVGLALSAEVQDDSTRGYQAPELKKEYVHTIETDIFAAGVVLLQLLTGLPAYDPKWGSKELPEFCSGNFNNTSPEKIAPKLFDPKIEWDQEIGIALFVEAMACVQKNYEYRKPTSQVLMNLQHVAQSRNIKEVNVQSTETKFDTDIENSDDAICQICFSQPTETRIYPCFHSVVCYQCAQELLERNESCPHCRSAIETVELGFFIEPYSPPLAGLKRFHVSHSESV